jgi:hypothetical protein
VTSGSNNSPGATVNAATVRWFGLLANDAAQESQQLSNAVVGNRNGSITLGLIGNEELVRPSPLKHATQVLDYNQTVNATANPALNIASRDIHDHTRTAFEAELWQAQVPIDLLPQELVPFESFVQRVSQWVRMFSLLEAGIRH